MPNIKSSIKRAQTGKARNLRNSSMKSEIRTAIKKASQAISNNSDEAEELYKKAVKLVDKAASKKVLHKNTASRKKGQLSKAFYSMQKSS